MTKSANPRIIKSANQLTWQDALREYALYVRVERGLTPATQEAYRRDLDRYVSHMKAAGFEGPQAVRLKDLNGFFYFLGEDCLLGARSLARNISTIRSFHGFLYADGLTEEDPSALLELPSFVQKLPVVLAVPEIEGMLAVIRHEAPTAQRDRAMIEMLYASGMRVSELIGLKLSQIYWEEGYLRLFGKGRKERLAPVGLPALNAAKTYIQGERADQKIRPGAEDYLFLSRRGGPLSRQSVFLMVKALAKEAGIEKNVSPHSFRHAFATHLIEGGADLRAVQDMLGHVSITTTEVYLHLDRSYLQEVHAQFHPRK
ncbi:MAG: site-specific tyrosine recombinase [Bacteroidia bacterium]